LDGDEEGSRIVAATLLGGGGWYLTVRGIGVDAAGACSFIVTAEGNQPPVDAGRPRVPLINPPATSLEGPMSFRYHEDPFFIYFNIASPREYGPLDTWRGGASV